MRKRKISDIVVRTSAGQEDEDKVPNLNARGICSAVSRLQYMIIEQTKWEYEKKKTWIHVVFTYDTSTHAPLAVYVRSASMFRHEFRVSEASCVLPYISACAVCLEAKKNNIEERYFGVVFVRSLSRIERYCTRRGPLRLALLITRKYWHMYKIKQNKNTQKNTTERMSRASVFHYNLTR